MTKAVRARAAGRRPTRRARAGVRTRILEAALELLRRGGPKAVTSVAIARRADIHQPNFYQYFASVDDCLRAAAETVATEFTRTDEEAFRVVREAIDQGRPYLELSLRYHEQMLERLLDNRTLTELFLRHRHDNSPFGRGMRAVEEQARARVVQNLWELAVAMGVSGRHLQEIALLAEFHISAMAAGVLALLEGRVSDPKAVARALAHNADVTARATFRRLIETDARSAATFRPG